MARKQPTPQQRRVEMVEVPKDDLLRILRAEAFAPEAATKIIGSGHYPDRLVLTVAFD